MQYRLALGQDKTKTMIFKKKINPLYGASFGERSWLLSVKRANVDASYKGFYIL